MLQDAGIPMPQLEDMVIRHQRKVDSEVNAGRVAKGLAPVAGAGGPSASLLGAHALQGDTTALT